MREGEVQEVDAEAEQASGFEPSSMRYCSPLEEFCSTIGSTVS